jgi:hypothetical protein
MKQLKQARLAHEQRRAHSFREAAKLPPPPPETPLTVSVSSGDQ